MRDCSDVKSTTTAFGYRGNCLFSFIAMDPRVSQPLHLVMIDPLISNSPTRRGSD
jgi:hypothetical protein